MYNQIFCPSIGPKLSMIVQNSVVESVVCSSPKLFGPEQIILEIGDTFIMRPGGSKSRFFLLMVPFNHIMSSLAYFTVAILYKLLLFVVA